MVDTACSPNRPQSIADSGQLGGKVRSIVERTGPRVLNDTVVIGTTMLADMFIRIAELTKDVRWQFGEQSDYVASVSPTSKYDGISLAYLPSPSPVG